MTGDRCPTCGRPPTVVEDAPVEDEGRLGWLRTIPRGARIGAAAVVVVLLFALLQAGFRFVS